MVGIVSEISEDDNAHHTSILCVLDFDASKGSAIACDSYLAFQVEARVRECLEVASLALADVDEMCSDGAIGGVAMESWFAIRGMRSCRVLFECTLYQIEIDSYPMREGQGQRLVFRLIDVCIYVGVSLRIDTKSCRDSRYSTIERLKPFFSHAAIVYTAILLLPPPMCGPWV